MTLPPENSNSPAGCGGDCLPRPAETDSPAGARTTAAYVLRYKDRWFGIEKRVTFEAEDVAAALAMIEHEPIGDWAELLKDGELICRRGGEPGGAPNYWVAD